MQLNYHIMDVFTENQMQGNPLAVVLKADHLKTWMMQKIANEFYLSETIFLSEPKAGRNTAEVRIFTPETELPFAGHPLIGAAVLLGLTNRYSAIRLEAQIGVVTCVMDRINRRCGQARFKLAQLPKKVREAPDRDKIAHTLGLKPEQISFGDFVPSCYSAGVEYVLVPVENGDALSSINLEKRKWSETYGADDVAVYAFCASENNSETDFCARMFDLALPRIEDPATGSAAAALIGLIADTTNKQSMQSSYFVEQGVDMGRASLIEMQVRKENGILIHAGIGGKAVLVGEGVLDLEWHDTV
ncbi:MAG: PhzF family phenazine biosynthesis protein [Devosiaceae bacterium]|nr:PhzF family phenazine biosynthesis protein [Devosiaceae bacterium]